MLLSKSRMRVGLEDSLINPCSLPQNLCNWCSGCVARSAVVKGCTCGTHCSWVVHMDLRWMNSYSNLYFMVSNTLKIQYVESWTQLLTPACPLLISLGFVIFVKSINIFLIAPSLPPQSTSQTESEKKSFPSFPLSPQAVPHQSLLAPSPKYLSKLFIFTYLEYRLL